MRQAECPERSSITIASSAMCDRMLAESQVRSGLAAGGRWIRTSGSVPAATPLSDRGVKPRRRVVRFAQDSSLEGDGFELPVPRTPAESPCKPDALDQVDFVLLLRWLEKAFVCPAPGAPRRVAARPNRLKTASHSFVTDD